MKHSVIALSLHSGTLESMGPDEFKVALPKGCEGVLLVFESKKAAIAYWGKDINCVRVNLPKRDTK